MKNKKVIALCACGLLFVTGIALGQDSASITVTCSIPEIPGVNSPLIQEKTQTLQNSAVLPAVQEESAENTHTSSTTPDTTETTQIVLAQSSASTDVLETYYSR
ncbi:MAG: hypothetical protein AB1530_03575 [Candidatus Omnitrophota bacterium]